MFQSNYNNPFVPYNLTKKEKVEKKRHYYITIITDFASLLFLSFLPPSLNVCGYCFVVFFLNDQ